MHIYQNLHPQIKIYFICRIIGILVLAGLITYCGILVAQYRGWFTGLLLGISCMYIIFQIVILWHHIYFNNPDNGPITLLFDFVFGIPYVLLISIAIGNYGTKDINNSELNIIIIFASIYYGIIAFVIILGIMKGLKGLYDLIKNTERIVEERNNQSILHG